ncbi:patatin-like phospholipase family protein [Bacillaceae bacterium]
MMWADAVFEGGGVKVLSLIGAVERLEEEGYRWKRLAGTSAGSILASLLAAGYSASELKSLFMDLDFRQFADGIDWGCFTYVANGIRLLKGKGLYRGERLEAWLDELLRQKGVRTFAGLPQEKLQIIASDITNGKMLILPQDIEPHGIPPAELAVSRAVRMSCSLPFFYQPVVIQTKGKGKIFIVDGGLLSNYPIWIFDRKGEPRWPTFGFRIASRHDGKPREIRDLFSYLNALFATMLETQDMKYVDDPDAIRTIFISSLGIKTTQFDLRREQKLALYREGRKAAEKFLAKWDFSSYVKTYRCGGNLPRRP